MHKKLQKNIQFLVKRSVLYVNMKKDKDFSFKKKNKVYLLKRNIKTKRLNNELNHIKLELFRILKTKKLVNYKLNLLTLMQIYSIFHIFLLKSADPDTSIQAKSPKIDSEN